MGIQVRLNHDSGVINGVTPRGQNLTFTYTGNWLKNSSTRVERELNLRHP